MIEATLIFIGDTIKYRDLYIKPNPYGWHVSKNDVREFELTKDNILSWHVSKNDVREFELTKDNILIGVSDIEDAVCYCKKYYDKLEETK